VAACLGLGMVVLASLLFPGGAEAQAVKGSYLYTLSSFTGAIREDFSRVTVDRKHHEVYVLYQNTVRVFNDSGMEVFHFGDDLDVGAIADVAVDDGGDIFLLVTRDATTSVIRCDYRGQPQVAIAFKGLPADFADFLPNRMVFEGGQFFLASTVGLKVVAATRDGDVTKVYDLFTVLELEEKDRGNVEIGGFSVDPGGNILLTLPVLFRAVALSPNGTLNWFGKPSSAPGGFNIVGGIARDSKGNYLVVDRLKAAILVFDQQFKFVTQFASPGRKPGNLSYPADLAIDARDRVYVTQVGRRGISVFTLTYL
jgi:6-bladed beta-propeller